VTPFLLGEMVERTKGKTLAANLAAAREQRAVRGEDRRRVRLA